LLFGLKKANPISTRIELGCLGLDGILWLVLAVFLVSSDAEDADVECFTSDAVSGQVPLAMPNFTTEAYQSQYRVMEAFSLFNVILIWAFLLLLLFLAWRHHSAGRRTVWTTPVTSFHWFYSTQDAINDKESKLPPPVTAPVDRSRSRGAGALSPPKHKHQQQQRARPQDLGKIRTTGLNSPPKTRQPSYEYKHGYWLPKSADAPPAPPPPPKATVSRSNTRDRQSSRDRSREGGRSHDRGRSHRSTTRDRSLTRGNSGSNRPAAGSGHVTRDRYLRDASPRR